MARIPTSTAMDASPNPRFPDSQFPIPNYLHLHRRDARCKRLGLPSGAVLCSERRAIPFERYLGWGLHSSPVSESLELRGGESGQRGGSEVGTFLLVQCMITYTQVNELQNVAHGQLPPKSMQANLSIFPKIPRWVRFYQKLARAPKPGG